MDSVTRERFDELTRFGESMDQALTESVALYSSKDDARNLLLGVLGHDLRTPLGAVYLTTEFLLRESPPDTPQSQGLAGILRSAGRMMGMVDDLLDFTQTALGVSLPISPSPIDLGELATHIVEEVGTVHRNRQVTLSREGDLSGHWDPERIGQMLSNLIGNAAQHGLPGSPISVEVGEDDDGAVLRVRNQGQPLPEQALQTLFSPLRQGTGRRAGDHTGSSGLGLGLHIAREIALAHGGPIQVDCADGTVTVSVRLPRKPPATGQDRSGNARAGQPER